MKTLRSCSRRSQARSFWAAVPISGSSIFQVPAEWRNPETKVVKLLEPLPESKPEIGCNENCAAMIGLLAPGEGEEAGYWTTWDAYCN